MPYSRIVRIYPAKRVVVGAACAWGVPFNLFVYHHSNRLAHVFSLLMRPNPTVDLVRAAHQRCYPFRSFHLQFSY